jgi:AAA domain
LRRILEGYFKILGGIDEKKACASFDGAERIVCRSLFSWTHDGSHSIHDDLYTSLDDQTVERYLQVFQRIFVTLGHEAHYNMMMGEVVSTRQQKPLPPEQVSAATSHGVNAITGAPLATTPPRRPTSIER